MAMIAGIFSKLLGTAFSRVGTIAFQKLLRLRKVDTVLRGGKIPEPSVQTAILDFETVIGTMYGEFTEDVDRFLRELERTGLITSIAEEAILKKRSAGTRAAFLDLHKRVIGAAAGDADALYDRLSFHS